MNSRIVALSAVSAALAVVMLALGSYIEVVDIACVMIAGIAMMIPLSKESFAGALTAFAASAVLGAVIGGARLSVILPYAVFFGLYPIANAFQEKKKINRYIALIIKDIWFLASMFLYYRMLVLFSGYDLFSDFSFLPETLRAYLVPGLFVFGALFFIPFDMVMMRMQKVINYVIERIKF